DDGTPPVDALRDAAQVVALVGAPAVPLRRAPGDRLDVPAQVRARAERLPPGAGEDRHVEILIVAEVVPDLPQILIDDLFQAVLVLGVVDRHVGDVPPLVVLHLAELQRHASLLSESFTRIPLIRMVMTDAASVAW